MWTQFFRCSSVFSRYIKLTSEANYDIQHFINLEIKIYHFKQSLLYFFVCPQEYMLTYQQETQSYFEKPLGLLKFQKIYSSPGSFLKNISLLTVVSYEIVICSFLNPRWKIYYIITIISRHTRNPTV